jgi:TolB-like protein/Tfp pilus assembly protein PilF
MTEEGGGVSKGGLKVTKSSKTAIVGVMCAERLAFGPFVLSPEIGLLSRSGAPAPVGYRAILLLGALLKRSGEVLTKSELIDAAWPDMAVEEGNLSVQIASLRKLLGSSSEGADWIVTVPRVGYRFVGVVERQASEVVAGDGENRLAATGPSIVVLPFANHSEDPEQEYFADGLTEDIITALARLRWLFVCARNSSFVYKAKAHDLRQVGRELGVRYILEGSVRRSATRIRINAQLADASTGSQIWAKRYDGELADFFVLQDQITESVVAFIEPQLYAAENQRLQSKAPESLDAWGLVMRAMPFVWTWGSAADLETAQQYLSGALRIDVDYPRANSLLAWVFAARVQLGWAGGVDTLSAALTMAQRAVSRDSEDPWSHLAAGYVHMVSRRFQLAVEELSTAIELNPSLAMAHVILGSTYGYGGMPDDGLHHLAIASRLSPGDYSQAGNLATQGLCHLMAGRFSKAVECERRAVQLRPHFGTAWRTLTAAAGLANDLETASHALKESKRLHPTLSIRWIEEQHPIVHGKDRDIYVRGLRAAGLT